jgi:hypothetical protein
VNQEIGAARASGKTILPIMLESGIRLPDLVGDLKYLSVHDEPQAALAWLRENISGRVRKKQQNEIIGWGILAVLGILALDSKE